MGHDYRNVNIRIDTADPRQKTALEYWRQCLADKKMFKAAGIFTLWSEAARKAEGESGEETGLSRK